MSTLVKIVDGFEIHFEALPEYCSLSQMFKPEEVDELSKQINEGELIMFVAKVSAHKLDVELSSDILGGCIYKSEAEFYTEVGGYFDDMVNTVVEGAKEKIKQLSK